MKLKKLIKVFVLILSICLALTFSACSIDDFIASTDEAKSIEKTYINEDGELIIEYSDKTSQNLGLVVGKDGVDGKDGTDGKDGEDGKDGQDGKDGSIIISGGSETGSISTSYAVANAIQSTVLVQSAFVNESDPATPSYSSGAGVIYSCNKSTGDALIITNYHVVFGPDAGKVSDDISVYIYGSVTTEQAIPATYVGGTMHYDLAVLKVSSSDIIKNSEVSAVNIKDSSKVHAGDTAFAIGNPRAEGFSVTSGIVSVDSETIEMTLADEQTNGTMRVMRIDTPVNSGNSGGGLFDENGNLIGIVNAKYSDSKIENIGYAIPSSTVVAITQNLIDNCLDKNFDTIKRPLLGIMVQVQNPYAKYNSETGYVDLFEDSTVVEITSESSIAYGKLFEGDIIRGIKVSGRDNVQITRQYQLLDALLYAKVGDVVTLTIEREGVILTAYVIITEECISNT